MLAVAAILSVFSVRRAAPVSKETRVCLWVSAVFFGYILCRAALSPVDYLWWSDFQMVQACLVVYLLTVFYIRTPGLRLLVIAGMLVLAMAEFGIAVRQFSAGDNWMPFGFSRTDMGTRGSGMFVSPIHLAGFLEALGMISLSLTVWSSWKWWVRAALGYLTIVCFAGVAISGSRGGYASVVFALVVFAWLTLQAVRQVNPERFARSAGIAVVAIILCLIAAIGAMSRSTMLHGRLNRMTELGMRLLNWQAALDQARLSPIVGTGAGTHLFYGRLLRQPGLQNDPEHAHNDYLELTAEYGVVGLAGISVFVFIHAYSGWLGVKRRLKAAAPLPFVPYQDNQLALEIGVLSAIATYLVHSITDFNLHVPGNALLFAFIFGMTANPGSEEAENRAPFWDARLFQLALPALGAWIIAGCAPKWYGDYMAECARRALYYKDLRGGADFAEKAVQHEPRNPFAYYLLAVAYARISQQEGNPAIRTDWLQKSEAASRAGLALYPCDEHGLALLARTLDAQKRYKEAGAVFQQAIAIDPLLGSLHAYYARHLSLVGRLDEAEGEVKKAQDLQSTKDPQKLIKDTPLGLSPGEDK